MGADGVDRLAGRCCPPLGAALFTVSRAFTGVPAEAGEAALDELGRRLFGFGSRPGAEAAHALCRLLVADPGFAAADEGPRDLLMDRVLERRRGHPLVLAVVLAEAGRRAGLDVRVLSSGERWFCGLGEGDRLHLVETGATPAPPPAAPIGCRCGHELAWLALGGLERRYAEAGAAVSARQARDLRARLPVSARALGGGPDEPGLRPRRP